MRRAVVFTIGIMIAALVAPAAATEPPAVYTCDGEVATHVGSIGPDTIRGTSGNDVIVGRGGDDVLIGNGGDDILCGGNGNDRLYGNGGFDVLLGGPGNDFMNGGIYDPYGDQRVPGFPTYPTGTISYSESAKPVVVDLRTRTATGQGSDTFKNIVDVVGSPFNDTIYGNNGSNTLKGLGGRDTIYGGGGHDTISGGDARDFLYGNVGNDMLYGDDGNDVINGHGGIDTINGGWGNDRLFGGPGDDTLHGYADDDYVNGGDGDDDLTGGIGTDTVVGRAGYDIGWEAETARSMEAWAPGRKCFGCDDVLFTTADAAVDLSVYPDIHDTSNAGWYDAAGTWLGTTNVTNYYGHTTHHYFHIAAAGRSAGAYRISCWGTPSCDDSEYGGWVIITN